MLALFGRRVESLCDAPMGFFRVQGVKMRRRRMRLLSEFLLATNEKWSHRLAFQLKANTGQIVKKITALTASNLNSIT